MSIFLLDNNQYFPKIQFMFICKCVCVFVNLYFKRFYYCMYVWVFVVLLWTLVKSVIKRCRKLLIALAIIVNLKSAFNNNIQNIGFSQLYFSLSIVLFLFIFYVYIFNVPVLFYDYIVFMGIFFVLGYPT